MRWIPTGAGFAFLGVALGAFGAHALQERVDAHELDVYKTATQYLTTHAFALILFGLFQSKKAWPGWCFLFGIVIFSGSLYALVFSGIKILGAITPAGGLLFMAGWAGFALEAGKRREKP
jgi:uncharacterized membrane protein YgdD (TMEM256/DUF423 family)